jgi:hypothetical protein
MTKEQDNEDNETKKMNENLKDRTLNPKFMG